MSWSGYWVQRARRSANRQRRLYGLEVPRALSALLEGEAPRLGFGSSLRVVAFVLSSAPRGRLRLFLHRIGDLDTPAQNHRIEFLAGDLRQRLSVRCRVATGSFERRNAARDLARVPRLLEKTLHRTRALLVVQPTEEGDVAAALAFAHDRGIPVFPRGISSSAFGGAVPTRNGMILDFSAMAGILEVDAAALTVRVQPGVRWADLASALEFHRLAPVTTPSSRFSTVGGWASTGGLGIDGYGYDHLRASIVAARVLLMTGEALVLAAGDRRLDDFVGTEGQLGVFSELTLKVRPRPGSTSPALHVFDGVRQCFAFMEGLASRGRRPSHVVFLDAERMVEENRLFHDRISRLHGHAPDGDGAARLFFEERDSVLVHYEDEGPASPQARYLWNERFFPLKAQRLGPGLLAAEVVLPMQIVPAFVERARRIADRFAVRPAVEVIVSRTQGAETCVTIVSFACDPARRWNYLLLLALVQILVHRGVSMGGRPYGLGIWNAPFAASCYPATRLRELMRRKREWDPRSLLNPDKFFSVRTRFFNLPGVLFRPWIFRTALRIASALSPLLGAAARFGAPPGSHGWDVPAPDAGDGTRLLEEAAARCTSCGACVSACPAYLLTRDERVTGRAKLRMAEAWLAGESIAAAEAHAAFQCLVCGLCEEVCQTRLPLRDCYGLLERRVERRHGYPAALVQAFTSLVDADRDRIRNTFGLDLPDWSPPKPQPSAEEVRP